MRYATNNIEIDEFHPETEGRTAMLEALEDGIVDLVFWDSIETLPEGTKLVGESFTECGPRLSFATYPANQKRKLKSDDLRRDFNCGLALIRQNGNYKQSVMPGPKPAPTRPVLLKDHYPLNNV